MRQTTQKQLKKRRSVIMTMLVAIILMLGLTISVSEKKLEEPNEDQNDSSVLSDESNPDSRLARDVLVGLPTKGRAAKTGYSRSEFGAGWASFDGCDTRNLMLQDGLREFVLDTDECTVLSGVLQDPYTNETIIFTRGLQSSADVQIDHVVALSDSWQKGAQELEFVDRVLLANDPLNLLAVDGSANQQKGDSDAASWLPPNKLFRCDYVARQIAVKATYELWVTEAERAAMSRVLQECPEQTLPTT